MLPSKLRAFAMAALVALAGLWPVCAAALKLPFTVGPHQGVFLHISDIHFDPLHDTALLDDLIKEDVDKWEGIFAQGASKHFETKDTNFPLLMSALDAAKGPHYDFILNTGDELVHDFQRTFFTFRPNGDYRAFVIKTLKFVDLMIAQTFPGVPLIATIGNNDSDCGDYGVAPGPMLTDYGEDLPVVAGDADALKSFKIGGYYVVPDPTVPKHDFIVLNSIFWSKDYNSTCAAGADLGKAEFDWLKNTVLDKERADKRTATLVMHIPPGIDADKSRDNACPSPSDPRPGEPMWGPGYTEKYVRDFLKLTADYKDVLRDAYAGHTHMDEFRVVSDANGKPYMTLQVTPAVSPRFGNNPAFAVMLYDRSDATVRDYATFYLKNFWARGSTAKREWKSEHTFTEIYGVQAYTPSNMETLAKSIRAGGQARDDYMKYFAAEGPPGKDHMTPANFMTYSCAQTAMTLGAFNACRCPNSLQPISPAQQ